MPSQKGKKQRACERSMELRWMFLNFKFFANYESSSRSRYEMFQLKFSSARHWDSLPLINELIKYLHETTMTFEYLWGSDYRHNDFHWAATIILIEKLWKFKSRAGRHLICLYSFKWKTPCARGEKLSLSRRLFGNELALFRTCHQSLKRQEVFEKIDRFLVCFDNESAFVPISVKRTRRDEKQASQRVQIASMIIFQSIIRVRRWNVCRIYQLVRDFFFAADWHWALLFSELFWVSENPKHFLHQTRWKGICRARDVIWVCGGRTKDKNYWHTEPNF